MSGGLLPGSPFASPRFRFASGLPAGEVARIRDDDNAILLTYRSFSSPVPVVATLVAFIVVVAGVLAAIVLLAERHPLSGIGSLMLSAFFSLGIVMLIPPINVKLYEASSLALAIVQRSRSTFPTVTYGVATPDGVTLALLQKSMFSRMGRNRWSITSAGGVEIARAVEESLARAFIRKLGGKFNRAFEADVVVLVPGGEAARIVRRGSGSEVDVLHVKSSAIDPRVAVALATLILGSEP
jgi:hypothetical protein